MKSFLKVFSVVLIIAWVLAIGSFVAVGFFPEQLRTFIEIDTIDITQEDIESLLIVIFAVLISLSITIFSLNSHYNRPNSKKKEKAVDKKIPEEENKAVVAKVAAPAAVKAAPVAKAVEVKAAALTEKVIEVGLSGFRLNKK